MNIGNMNENKKPKEGINQQAQGRETPFDPQLILDSMILSSISYTTFIES